MDVPLPPLIEQMLRPDFYPHPVVGPIQLIQTHISYVLLTGEYAYKIKKPVQLSFLDFSTLEQRRYFCQEELRLNRRLSPELYLAVLPIVALETPPANQSVSFSITLCPVQYRLMSSTEVPAENIVEYAVQMRQFPQETLFSRMLAKGELTEDYMRALGEEVALFHRSAEADERIRRFGDVELIRTVVEDNYAVSIRSIGQAQTQTQFEQTRTFTNQFLIEHADWFHQRQEQNKIRECHGDLHLNNVCLYHNQIQIFDCIEFSEKFRNIDVLYEIAFTVMDLDFQGRPDLANVFLNTYLEQTGDYWGAVLLPFYCSLRATIRANVNALLLEDPVVLPEEKERARQRATAYYQLARAYAQSRQSQLILMAGLSGSGKTTVARHLAQKIGAIHIRSDAVRKQMAGIPLHQRGSIPGNYRGGIYTPEMTHRTYKRLLELGIFLARHELSVILDAKYDRHELRWEAITQAQTNQIPIKIFYCTAPLEVLRHRLQTRTGDIADATADILIEQQKEMEPFTEAEQNYVKVLDTTQDLNTQIA